MMLKEKFIEYYMGHRGAINGALAGFLFAVFILLVGFLKALFIVLCTGIGYYIGKRISEEKDYLKNLLDRVLPPGTYR
jgi:uncharacterized membrane protein